MWEYPHNAFPKQQQQQQQQRFDGSSYYDYDYDAATVVVVDSTATATCGTTTSTASANSDPVITTVAGYDYRQLDAAYPDDYGTYQQQSRAEANVRFSPVEPKNETDRSADPIMDIVNGECFKEISGSGCNGTGTSSGRGEFLADNSCSSTESMGVGDGDGARPRPKPKGRKKKRINVKEKRKRIKKGSEGSAFKCSLPDDILKLSASNKKRLTNTQDMSSRAASCTPNSCDSAGLFLRRRSNREWDSLECPCCQKKQSNKTQKATHMEEHFPSNTNLCTRVLILAFQHVRTVLFTL